MTSTRIHAAILALRNVVQVFMAERDLAGLPASPLVLSDLRHDERTIGGNPDTCFAFFLAPTCTYLLLTAVGAYWSGRALEVAWAPVLEDIARTLDVVSDGGELYFWDGGTLHRCPTVDALATRFGDELRERALKARDDFGRPGSRHAYWSASCNKHGVTDHMTVLGGACVECHKEGLVAQGLVKP